MDFRVDLEIFRGPLDLLLYLVRKHEVEIGELPIAPITEQFLEYLDVLQQIDVGAVGDFVDMASTLIEMKSRSVLPHGGEEQAEVDLARQQLVEKLLEYKKFKDAASMLEERGRAWQERFGRQAIDVPARPRSLADEPIHEVELWDLVSAWGRIVRDNLAVRPASIVYDETPIHVHMERIHERLRAERRLAFRQLFEPGMHKSTLVGLFLAVLELVRNYGVQAEQSGVFGELWIVAGPHAGPIDVSPIAAQELAAARETGNRANAKGNSQE
jgi:segregation and condensation protein A